MTTVFDKDGAAVPATVIGFESPNYVTQKLTTDKNGYSALQVCQPNHLLWVLKTAQAVQPFITVFCEAGCTSEQQAPLRPTFSPPKCFSMSDLFVDRLSSCTAQEADKARALPP